MKNFLYLTVLAGLLLFLSTDSEILNLTLGPIETFDFPDQH
ncbi:hypothetical protein [Tenuibacillus multivorans]|uniref:Uncharacterized protein n=1 Tax=Tenuibacillus multivorans TaxID=237069 RepID=A0A1G9YMZ5_9BACI|nr:hypothetical protein [Tenuibacillus multivorans]GEL78459.1 hypothetical protein TMU01_26940 [Tenuibacillus multivorans]SDN09843.1 hypothetical protein SAMN05216498_1462 [Tenuibacillus multivorans]